MAPKGKAKKSGATSCSVDEQRIRDLERSVLESAANANNIVDLIEFCGSDEPKTVHSASQALQRVFIHFIETGELAQLKAKKAKTADDARAAFRKWLHGQYLDFIKLLLGQLAHNQSALQVAALNMLMAFVEAEALKLTQTEHHVFPNALYQRVVVALVDNQNFNDALLDVFVSKYLNKYDDVRYYTYKNISSCISIALRSALLALEANGAAGRKRRDAEALTAKIVAVLKQVNFPTVADELDGFLAPLDDDSDSDGRPAEGARKRKAPSEGKGTKVLRSLNAHKHVFSDCWLAILRRPMNDEVYKRVLVIMHKQIMPHLVNPRLLIDFLTESYERGGVISVLALNGLFILMTEHNLDYPDFYKKLYALFDLPILYVKYRDRFFHLCGIFLRSPLLPSYLVAAFIKRSMRLALRATPAGISFVMPFAYNLLLKHPQCMPMIHRERSQGTDPYVMDEADPAKCHAIESSLWELDALQQHYSPTVAKFSDVFFNVFQKKEYDIDEFLGQDYGSLFDDEMGRRQKDIPAVEIVKPTGVLLPGMDAIWEA